MKAFPCDDGTGTSPTPVASSLLGGLHHAFLPATRRHPILCPGVDLQRQGQLRRHPRPRRGRQRFARLLANPDRLPHRLPSLPSATDSSSLLGGAWHATTGTRLADTCRVHKIPFVLGRRRWAMKAVHGLQDLGGGSQGSPRPSARLLKGGNFPPSYAYPKERRGLRGLLRRSPPPGPPAARRTVRPHPHLPGPSRPTPASRLRGRCQVQE